MSRVGKSPVSIPEGVDIKVEKNIVRAKGPKGELYAKIHPTIKIRKEDNTITVERPSENKLHKSLHGLSRSLIANIINGVTKGYEKRLKVIGVGYRADMKGNKLLLNIGYAHQILFEPPEEIDVSVDKDNVITVKGINKELVGQVAAKIRSFKKPEPYKGKGIRYVDEYVRRKAGKTAA